MKKQLYILAIGFIALASSSCNDFLDREPLDSVPTSQYLFNENDLSAYTANMYGIFPVHAGYAWVRSMTTTTVTIRPDHLPMICL